MVRSIPYNAAVKEPFKKLRMSRLIDRWTPAVFLLFTLLKGLQIFRFFGASSKEGGWRTGMQAYSRTEHSKFALAVFRLDLWADTSAAKEHGLKGSASHLITRLGAFLKDIPEVHWQLRWTGFAVTRERKAAIDIVSTDFAPDGTLRSLTPYFGGEGKSCKLLSQTLRHTLNTILVQFYNETLNAPDKKRPWILQKRLRRWLLLRKWRTPEELLEARGYLYRILSSVMIHFEELTNDPALRFQGPNLIQRKHFGLGLMNIFARLTADHSEADLWFQFHHIPVDGVPMQEVLTRLKKDWGVLGELKVPERLLRREPVPVLCSTDKGERGTYLATRFLDFRSFLKFRKELEKRYSAEAPEGFTAAGLLMWSLAHHPVFHGKKFLFPVDVAASPAKKRDRGIEVVFIRPSKYFDATQLAGGFLDFEKEFSQRIEASRDRSGESYEMLELYALTSPFIYGLTRRVTLKALGEFIGTVGLTIIKDAEVFITPLSEIHTDGFLSFGNFSLKTEDGGSAGCVSARGSALKVSGYLEAVSAVVSGMGRYF